MIENKELLLISAIGLFSLPFHYAIYKLCIIKNKLIDEL